jgi:hypothetical protein
MARSPVNPALTSSPASWQENSDRAVRVGIPPALPTAAGPPSAAMQKTPRHRTLFAVALAAAGLVATALVGAGAAAPRKAVEVTFVGDSVPASITYTPQAQAILSRGLDLRLDLRVCRRLVTESCSYQGAAPPTALQSVQAVGHGLGDVLIVDVGYNESAVGYREGIDRIMRAARAQGAVGVVWVTLRETRDIYRQTNVAIRAAQKRWPQLQVADWNAYSRGKPWFSSDGLHMGPSGAEALARFLRPFVFRAAKA